MTILDINNITDEKKAQEFHLYAKEELNKLIQEQAEGKLRPEDEANRVHEWAKKVFKEATGVDFNLSPFKDNLDYLYNISQRRYQSPTKNIFSAWGIKLTNANPFSQMYTSVKISLEAALSPYPEGRPSLEKLKFFVNRAPTIDDADVIDYSNDLATKASDAHKVAIQKMEKKAPENNSFHDDRKRKRIYSTKF